MRLFPKEKIILQTGQSSDLILEKIKSNIIAERDFNQFSPSKLNNKYEGVVFPDKFRINRILTFKSSFLPITFGDISNTETGSEIKLTIKMRTYQFTIFMIWTILLGSISIFSLFVLIMELLYSGRFTVEALLAPAVFLVGYLGVIINFNKEMVSTKVFLITLTNAKEVLRP